MSDLEITEDDGSVTFAVRVIPRSSKTEIVGEYDGALKVKLTSPPVGGAANEELIKLMSKQISVSRSAIKIVSGQTSKIKLVCITGIASAQIDAILKAKT